MIKLSNYTIRNIDLKRLLIFTKIEKKKKKKTFNFIKFITVFSNCVVNKMICYATLFYKKPKKKITLHCKFQIYVQRYALICE